LLPLVDAVLACEFKTEKDQNPRIEWKKKGHDVSFVYYDGHFKGTAVSRTRRFQGCRHTGSSDPWQDPSGPARGQTPQYVGSIDNGLLIDSFISKIRPQ
jgi:hypothetical protein